MAKFTPIFILLITLAGNCLANSRQKRLVGGEDTTHLEYPSIAVLIRIDLANLCTGALLSSTKIATSASCCNALGPGPLGFFVASGVDNVWQGNMHNESIQISYPIDRVVIDSNYGGNSSVGWVNDACKIFLSAPLRLDSHTAIVPICTTEPSPGQTCTWTGWGSTAPLNEPFKGPNLLQKMEMTIIPKAQCAARYSTAFGDTFASNSNFCAIPATPKDKCVISAGDGGAPMFCRNSGGSTCLAGIHSFFGIPCSPGAPQVFNNARALRDFYTSN